jgi:hypothetical protein
MRAIIIQDTDAKALLASLELAKLRGDRDWSSPAKQPTAEDFHRAFHYVVCRWLQEQGADVSPTRSAP